MGSTSNVDIRSLSIPSSSNTPLVSASGSQQVASAIDLSGLLSLSQAQAYRPPILSITRSGHAIDEDVEGEDELLPAMADDDYSAQLSWQSQSKDNLKVLMDNFSPAQYDRFEAYRRHALPKQAVRKVIQQTLGQQVSQPVAQIIAGFSKVSLAKSLRKLVQSKRVGEKLDLCHLTIYVKHIEPIKMKQGTSVLPDLYALRSCLCDRPHQEDFYFFAQER